MAEIEKKAYRGNYPSQAKKLIEMGICSAPRQKINEDLKWAWALDIVYTFHGLTPKLFSDLKEDILLLAAQEANRYSEYKWKFAGLDVKLGRLKKGKDLEEVVTFQAAMHDDGDTMVFGPGYETPENYWLHKKVDDIINITKRYAGKLSRQNPYTVVKLFISIREPKEYVIG